MKKFLVIFLSVVIIITPCLGAKKSLQGDFQVFKLGESRKKVIRKIKEYVKEGKVEFVPGEGNRITLIKDNLLIYFRYFRNKLYMISILYPDRYKGLTDSKDIVSSLRGLLVETYGQAAEEKEIPDKTDPAQLYICANWGFAKKNIDLVIRTDSLNIATVMVDIYNPIIREKADPESVKDFGPSAPDKKTTDNKQNADQKNKQ